jgi:hypothetical protein
MSRQVPRLIPVIALAALCCASARVEAAGSAKFHVVLRGGPFAGTYDVTADACMAGLQKQGSWHATWEAEIDEKGKLSAVLLGIDPKPTFGNGLTILATHRLVSLGGRAAEGLRRWFPSLVDVRIADA